MTAFSEDERKFFNVALQLVQSAGYIVEAAFSQPQSEVKTKTSDVDLLTETDQAVEKHLIEGLLLQFPDHQFIGEESVASGAKIVWSDAPTWIIDPIDGTTNFVHRIPLIAICVGLSIRKEIRAGIVYNPISKELYSAQFGCGAYKNGFPIKVSSTTAMNRSLIAASHGVHNLAIFGEKWMDISLKNFRNQCLAGIRGHRYFGSAAINMINVAQGSVDSYVEYGCHIWDFAAAAVIVLEAGGIIIDPTGSEFDMMTRRILCASTMELAKEISSGLCHVEYKREESAASD